MTRLYALYIIVSTVVLCSCSNGTSDKGASSQRAEETGVCSALELPLPDVPAELTDPKQRADYVMWHFWDAMDFRDTVRSHSEAFMERNVVNFMALFPHGNQQPCERSIGKMLRRAATDSVAFSLTIDIMERYLNDPNSPMRNEECYILYLQELLRMPGLDEATGIRASYQLSMAKKNRPGTAAADFAYTDSDGRCRTLHTTEAKRLLLLFYDPECTHCSEILKQVSGSEVVRGCVEKGELTVLAVYTEGNRKVWDETKRSMPRWWIVGYDEDSIVERELYSIPAMPVMYLLDSYKKVLLKDATLPMIEQAL